MSRLVVVALLATLVGCATPRGRFGTQARYEPKVRGYVFGVVSEEDDAAASYVLLNPVTGKKLRCADEVERWLEVERDTAADAVSDDNVETAAGVFIGLGLPVALLPALLFTPSMPASITSIGGLVGVETGLLVEVFGLSEAGYEVFEDARELAAKKQWGEAAQLYERALSKDGSLRMGSLALYELGVAYAQVGKIDEAREALHTFVARTLVHDEKAFENAERWLRWLDDPVDRCTSRKPFDITW